MPNSLQIPPYRAALLTGAGGAPVIRSNGPDSEPVMTERQWYMFWQNLAGQVNDHTQTLEGLGNIVTFGNHADRPNPGPWPDGALYVEWDRGSVLYQNQGGIWVYIAGQMFGTLSPDQRPADLGMPDAGFAFRTNVDPARAFAWSGTAWIETTPIRYGTHAERLAAPIAGLVSGMLWMETDRGSVIYQNQSGTWLFITGIMYGTLSPDQRPTGLGGNDAGFRFEATDTLQQFRWDGAAWVALSLWQPGYYDLAVGTSNPTFTLSPVAVPGMILTLPRSGVYSLRSVTDMIVSGVDGTLLTQINVNGLALTGGLTILAGASGTRATTASEVRWTGSAGQVVTVTASKTSGTGGSILVGSNSMLSATWISA